MPGARTVTAVAAALICALGVGGAIAQQPSASAGRAIAERFCAGCHLIGDQAQSGPVPAGIPSFAAIASRPGQTASAIAGRIVMPHPPMPDANLTRTEIADVTAYILSLAR